MIDRYQVFVVCQVPKYVVRYHEISEAVSQRFLKTILQYNRREIDSKQSFEELKAEYDEVIKHLKFPLKVYRAFSWENIDELTPDVILSKIDFDRIGTSWTWDKDCAVVGGVLEYRHMITEPHLILEALVTEQNVDMLITISQNITIYQEEKEVRLKPNSNVRIINSYPEINDLPRNANTGPEGWDTRASRLSAFGINNDTR